MAPTYNQQPGKTEIFHMPSADATVPDLILYSRLLKDLRRVRRLSLIPRIFRWDEIPRTAFF